MGLLSFALSVAGIFALAAAAYYPCLLFLTFPRIQRFLLYLNYFNTRWIWDPKQPSKFRITPEPIPLTIKTPDGIDLFAWLMLPSEGLNDFLSSLSDDGRDGIRPNVHEFDYFELIRRSTCRFIIHFHGNSGCVSEWYCLGHYRALLSQSTRERPICVLTIDYRGFGHSTGFPTEAGLVTDGIATVNFVKDSFQIPAERILLVGHSLGSAVASATYAHFFLDDTPEAEKLAGLVLISPFTDLPRLIALGVQGRIRIWFDPLIWCRIAPIAWMQRRVVDSWDTWSRLQRVIRECRGWNINVIHAFNDWKVDSVHGSLLEMWMSDEANKKLSGNLAHSERKRVINDNRLGEGQSWRHEESWGSQGSLRKMNLWRGGHDKIITLPETAETVVQMYDRPWLQDE